MNPRIDSALRAKLHRILDEVLAEPPEGGPAAPTFSAVETQTLLAHLAAAPIEARSAALEEGVVQVGELAVDLEGHEVFSAGRRVHLTHREFALLRFLVLHRGKACKREDIVANAWADRALDSERTVDIHIHRLRQKLGRPFAELLETLRKVGYKLRATPLPRDTRLRRTALETAYAPGPRRELTSAHALGDAPLHLTASLAGLRD